MRKTHKEHWVQMLRGTLKEEAVLLWLTWDCGITVGKILHEKKTSV